MLERPTSACTPLWHKINGNPTLQKARRDQEQRITGEQLVRDEIERKEREIRDYWCEIREILNVSPLSTSRTRLRAQDILYAILIHYNIRYEDIYSEKRSRRESIPRWHCMWLLRTHKNWTMAKIGEFMCRDHSSVVHGVRRWEEIMREGKQT